MMNGICSSWIPIFGFEDQKHRAKYSLNALRASSTRRARSSSSFSLSLISVEYAFGGIEARHRFAATRLGAADAFRGGRDRCDCLRLPKCAKRLGVRQSSGAFRAELPKIKNRSRHQSTKKSTAFTPSFQSEAGGEG